MDKALKHDVELLESGEDTSESLEPSEEALDFIASTLYFPCIRPIHQHPHSPVESAERIEQCAAFERVMGLTGRAGKP